MNDAAREQVAEASGQGRLSVPRAVATAAVVGAVSTLRLGAGHMRLLGARTPALARLAVLGTADPRDARRAQVAFRDEFIALMRDSAELSWRELRRGVDQVSAKTRLEDDFSARAYRRPYRVKR